MKSSARPRSSKSERNWADDLAGIPARLKQLPPSTPFPNRILLLTNNSLQKNKAICINTSMKNEQLFLLREAAEMLNCQPYQITYLLNTKKVPEPKRIGGRRCFCVGDLLRLAEKLNHTLEIKEDNV